MKEKNEKEILKIRAQFYAKPVEETEKKINGFEVLQFLLAKEKYAFDIELVREVYSFADYSPIPCCPPHVLGVANVRGQMIPLVDLKRFFDIPQSDLPASKQAIIISLNGIELGILADEIVGLQCMDSKKIQPGLPTLTGMRGDFLTGIGEDQVVILDGRKILMNNSKALYEQQI